MPNIEQMSHVANSCSGYDAVGRGFQSSIGTKFSKSCENCHHLINGICEEDLFDSVLSGLDQG